MALLLLGTLIISFTGFAVSLGVFYKLVFKKK